jgi:hypothetical protein
MKKLIVIGILLLVPQLSAARVYMCVDSKTGKTSFTDKACQTTSVGEEVRVDATNLDSGSRARRGSKTKTWRSEEETRKTGLEYNNERRDIYDNSATASSD